MEAILSPRIQFRPTKRVSLGIDLGSSFVRAAIWSTSKKRPALLSLIPGGALSGPGTEYAVYKFEEEVDNPTRIAFVTCCIQIFKTITETVELHYGPAMHVEYQWVTVISSVDDTYYRQAIEDAASRVGNFAITKFLSCQLACLLGTHSYLQFQHPDHPSLVPQSSMIGLVVDIGAASAKLGLVRTVLAKDVKMLSAVTCKSVSMFAIVEAIQLALDTEEMNSTTEQIRNIGAQNFCNKLIDRSISSTELVNWFQRAVQHIFKSLGELVKQVIASKAEDLVVDQLILTGAGNMLPGLLQVVENAVPCTIGSKFFPKWNPNLFVAAMGAAVQTGIDRQDRTSSMTSVDMNTNQVFLQVFRNGVCNQTCLVLGHNSAFPFVNGLILGRGEEGTSINKFKLCEEVTTVKDGPQLVDICTITLNNEIIVSQTSRFSIIVSKFDSGIRTKLTVNMLNDELDEMEGASWTCTDREFIDSLIKDQFRKKKMSFVKRSAVVSNSSSSCSSEDRSKVGSTVFLEVLRAEGLKRADMFGKSDPYCVASLNGQVIGKTDVCKRTLDPIWNSRFFLSIPNMALKSDDVLQLDVYDHDKFTSHDFLGRAVVQGDQIAKDHNEICCALGTREDLPLKKQKFVQGKIYLRFQKQELRLSQSMLDMSQLNINSKFSDDDDDDDTDDESQGSLDLSAVDLKLRWRIISGNVPVSGFITQ